MRQLLVILLYALAIFIVAWAGIALTRSTGRVAGVWLANGLAVAILLRRPPGERLALLAAGGIANILANSVTGDSFVTAALFTLVNLLEITTVVAIFGRRFGHADAFESAAIGRYLVIAGAAPILPAALASAWLAWTGGLAPGNGFATWFGSDILGLLIVAPILLAISPDQIRAVAQRRSTESVVVPMLAAGLATLIFSQGSRPLLFLVTPSSSSPPSACDSSLQC